jgi:hypothetical protein
MNVPTHTWTEFRAMRRTSPLLHLFARDASVYLLMYASLLFALSVCDELTGGA